VPAGVRVDLTALGILEEVVSAEVDVCERSHAADGAAALGACCAG
jgi:hypothetical protein